MSKRKHISENSNYFLIASHSRIHRNVGLQKMPEGTWLLPLAKCLLPGKVSHNREYNTFFHNFGKVKNFVRTHPAGFYGPGDIYQDVMISAAPQTNSNRLVHGVIKLPLPKGSNLSNKTKLLNYQMQNLSVAQPGVKQGKVRLSQILKNRPGTYIGAFCRIANNITWKPKARVAELRTGKVFVPSNANLPRFLKEHGLNHAVQALRLERRARGPPATKENVRRHIDKYKPTKVSVLNNSNSNNNAYDVFKNNKKRRKTS
jgi:hypothetical protein